ncbi:MAG: triose-phosphate isomerase [Bacilli bacterium]|nr:triose-phosphate isomerase [Bacilli bacterium]
MIIVLNNKNNFIYDDFVLYRNKLKELKSNSSIILCPSICYLSMCINDSNYELGAQKISNKREKAITGSITAEQLKALNVKYCIVGHSDFCDDKIAAKNKMLDLLRNEIIPILCVSDDDKELSLLDKEKSIKKKLDFFLADVEPSYLDKLYLAYEPYWAVNKNFDLDYEEIEYLINSIKDEYPNNKVLYGGGINSYNFNTISKIDKLDGLLIGRFGNDVDNFKNYI